MANRHLLLALSRSRLAALVKTKHQYNINVLCLVIVLTISIISLFAFSTAASLDTRQDWRQHEQQLSPLLEYQLLQDASKQPDGNLASLLNDKSPMTYGSSSVWPTSSSGASNYFISKPIEPAQSQAELIDQLKLAKLLLEGQIESDLEKYQLARQSEADNAANVANAADATIDSNIGAGVFGARFNQQPAYHLTPDEFNNDLGPLLSSGRLSSRSAQDPKLLANELLLLHQLGSHRQNQLPTSILNTRSNNNNNDDLLSNNFNADTDDNSDSFANLRRPFDSQQLKTLAAVSAGLNSNSIAPSNAPQDDSGDLVSFGKVVKQPSEGVDGTNRGQLHLSKDEDQLRQIEIKRLGASDDHIVDHATKGDSDKVAPTASGEKEARFTTLLEDETNIINTNNRSSSSVVEDRAGKKSNDHHQSSTLFVVDGQSEGAYKYSHNNNKLHQTTHSADGNQSLFRRIYNTVASYMPFMSQTTHASNSNVGQARSSKSGGVETAQHEIGKVQSSEVRGQNDKSNRVSVDGSESAKQRVSKQSESDNVSNDRNNVDVDVRVSSSGEKAIEKTDDNNNNNDKFVKIKLNNDISEKQRQQQSTSASSGSVEDDVDLSSPEMGTFTTVNDDDNSNKQQRQQTVVTTNMKRLHLDQDNDGKMLSVDLNDVLPGQSIDPEAIKKVSLIRQSTVGLPLGLADDFLVRATSSQLGPGKYVYAPTQHYYLNAVKTPDNVVNDDGPSTSVAGDGSVRRAAFLSQLINNQAAQPHVGSHIYSSYEPALSNHLKPAYAFQQKGQAFELGAPDNKSNDLYFLIMVGAFCVMAMAVVLAAGLFAYRVQQNRKSSQDIDYPTYGVVGPNNLNGKCGAAAFVGGYLGHNNNGVGGSSGGGSFGSKSGSSKHLPDLYACSDSGITSSTDKASSKKTSSVSASSDSQLQQHAAGAKNNNFLANNQDAARMYHYQHQKQQMIISDRNSAGRHTSASDLDSEDENEDGSYTVYECPGLASAHEMEIKNPLFNDDQSP